MTRFFLVSLCSFHISCSVNFTCVWERELMRVLCVGDVEPAMLSVVKLATEDLDHSSSEEEVKIMLFQIE